MREDLIMALAEEIMMVMILSIVFGLVAGWYFTYLYYHSHDPEVTDLAKRLPPSQLPAPPPHDKCQDCDKVKGCVTCHDGDQYEHTEQIDDVFAAFTKEYMAQYDDEIVCVYDRYAGLVDGIRWQRKQMLNDAVDGEVTHGKNLTIPSLAYFLDKNGLDYGDKVKVIIIKKD